MKGGERSEGGVWSLTEGLWSVVIESGSVTDQEGGSGQ